MKDFEIGLKIKDESELYNAFDPNGEMLSADVLSYVLERFGEKNPGEKPILRIITTQEIDKERLQRAFDLQIDRMQIKLKSDEKKNTIKQLWMFLIGVVCISFGIYAAGWLSVLPGEIISTVGAFSLWEAASVWIVENPKSRMERRRLELMRNMQLTVESYIQNGAE